MKYALITFPVLLLSLYGLGEWLRSIILGREPFSISRIARAFGLGIVAHGILMTLLGFVWLYRPYIVAPLTVLPALVFWKFWWTDLKEFFSRTTWKTPIHLGFVEILFIVALVGINLLRGFNALAPNISWDATSHHFLVADVWLKAGRLSDIPSVIFSCYPSLTEVSIGATMALGTDYLSNLFGWICGPLAALIIIGICTRHSDILFHNSNRDLKFNPGRLAGITGALLFTLFAGVGVQTSGGYVDLPLACWILLTIDLMFEFRKFPTWRVLIVAALFAGASLATKHLALIIFPGFIAYFFWLLFSDRKNPESGKITWPHFFAFIGIALLLVLPWYIRSAWFTGNPFYPFGILGLPTPPQPPFTSDSWVRPDYQRSLLGFVTYWYYLYFTPTIGHALGRNYSLAFPVLLPLMFLVPRLKSDGRILAILGTVTILVMYALTPVETRYHLPFIAVLAMVFGILLTQWMLNGTGRIAAIGILISTAIGIYYLFALGRFEFSAYTSWTLNIVAILAFALTFLKAHKLRTTAISLLIIVLATGSFLVDINDDVEQYERRHSVILDWEFEKSYLYRESPFNYGIIDHINTRMDWPDMRILCLEPRLYRLKADWVTWFGLKEDTVPTTPGENVAVWYRGGFTHILLGDDVMVKALMYYNIVHLDGWDIPGASPGELLAYLDDHPEEDTVHFQLQELWTSFDREPFGHRARHFTHFWLPREIEKERYPVERINNVPHYSASRSAILTDPERLAQYAFVRDFRELVVSGGLEIVYSDQMTYLFRCDYPAYLESHPDVDLETLGID